MNKMTSLFLCGLAAAIVSASAVAGDEPPDIQVRNVTHEVLTIVRGDRALLSGDHDRLAELVEQKVLPNFNFRRMTGLAVGHHWRTATVAQQDRLVALFRSLLVRTYSNALSQYKDQSIEFRPLRGRVADGDVMVQADIRQPGAPPIALDFRLEKGAEGWKVYDIAVAGVSLVTNYRGSFSQEVQRRGLDGLIQSLEDKNRQLASDRARS
jgi:phospholipid transport system substrate-binding protein